MTLPAGSVLGPYELLAPVGAGGMGQVYRARDTRLGRTVAVKVLPPKHAGVADFVERFKREARAISSLNHPNICALFDVGETKVDGQEVSYLVMELLDGETLRDRLRLAMPLRQALDVAVQVANGLAAAHRKGLIHRDLKPENIFLTRDGVVKILDFGLVKDAANLDAQATEPGLVVGTAAYMSPEQIRGTALDARSDIFAFGVVLYEMLAGTPPFHGDSPFETMTQILHEEPPPLPDGLPPGIPEIAERCLAREPEERFASARDLAFSLDAIARGARMPSSGAKRTRSSLKNRKPVSRRRAWWAAALAVLLIVIVGGARLLSEPEDAPEPPTMRTLTHSGRDASPAASADGRLVAFVSNRDGQRRIWLEQLSDGTEVALTSGGDDSSPRFSPDGSTILFTRVLPEGASLWRVAVVGGEARKAVDNAFDADYAPDGKRIAFIRNRVDGNRRLSTLCIGTAGSAAVVEVFATPQEELRFPRWSPDGEWIAVSVRPRGTAAGKMLLIRPDGSGRRSVERREPHGLVSAAAWTRDSRRFVFAELEGVGSVALRTRGGAARLFLYDLGSEHFRMLLWNPHASADTLDLLPNGRVIFSEDFTRQNLQEVVVGGGTRWLTRGTATDRQPAWSADGSRIVFCSDRSGNPDVWELTVASGGVRRLTDDPGVDWDPAVLPDGGLLWSSNRAGHFEIWTADREGGNARQLSRDGADAENPTAPADAAWIYYDSSHPEKEGLWRMRKDGSGAAVVMPGETAHPEVSHDGAYVLYHRPDDIGGAVIEAVRVADGVVVPIARRPTLEDRPHWLGATHAVVFRDGDRLIAQDLGSTEQRVLATLDADTTLETFAVSPDGKRLVLSLLESSSGLMIAEGVGVE